MNFKKKITYLVNFNFVSAFVYLLKKSYLKY